MSQTDASLLAAIQSKQARIGVVGLGYVGLPLAVTAATNGYRVTGFDVDATKMDLLNTGDSYIEAVDDQALAAVSESQNFEWTTDFSQLAGCQAIIICVPTPLTKFREPDLSFVTETAKTIAAHMSSGTLIVLESTTFPGTTADVLTPILETSGLSAGKDIFVAFSPEREDPGNKDHSTATIPKIVGGDTEETRLLAQALYQGIVDKVVMVASAATAEAVKLTENIFRSVNIALVNELKVIYDAMGIDVWDVIDGAATKPFGYMPFYPGPGLGGHCIPIDPFYLTWKAREFELSTRFIELAGEINVAMPEYVVGRVREVVDRVHGKGLSRARVLIIGIAYKKNVSDMRESPSVKLLELLEQAGAAVDFHDPHVAAIPKMRNYPGLEGRQSIAQGDIAAQGYDLVLIATDHDKVDYAMLAELDIPIVDTRNVFARRDLPMTNVTKA